MEHAEFVGHSCKLCAVEVELTDGAREAVIRVVVGVTKFVEDREEIGGVLKTFFIRGNISSDGNVVDIKDVTPTMAAWQFKSPPLGVRELNFENASDGSTHVVVKNVGVL
jgi:hypothetical protein